ncbi:interleukin-1 receptor type 1-like [Silurus meridionalis]|nr:interleukin-1 receptor type 1-like [Silurus meridionalis]
MVGRSKVNESLRQQDVQMKAKGMTLSAITRQVGHSKSVISRILKLYNITNSFKSAKKAGRPRKTNTREDRKLRRIIMGNRFHTAAGIAHQFSAEQCLSFTEHLEICAGQVYILNCGSIFENNVVNVNWTREQTQDWDTGIKIINQSLWFFPVQESHRGKYTCYYFSVQEVYAFINAGSKLVLNCKVFVGHGSCEMDRAEFHNLYWLWNNSFMEDLPQHITTNNCTTEDNVEYLYSNLTIMEVQQEFFNIPYYCVILTSYGYDNGTVTLIQYSQRELYCTMAVLVAYAAVALGFVLFYMFKVDLVLAYRNLSPCLKQQNDGKLYDAYVSYLSEDCQSVSSATDFALKVLPDVLENQLGYSLFISCRDAPPGTAIHDVISETVGKSRRIIIVLPPQDLARPSKGELLNKMPNKHLSLNNNITAIDPDVSELSGLNWGPYECWVGLHDALIKECMQVILVQVGAEVDDALLSESLRYVKNTQGILKWKQCYTKKPNGRFWKQMRYRMPPPRKARTAVMV